MTWITDTEVADRLGLEQPDAQCTAATNAARAYVERVRSDLFQGTDVFQPSPDVVEGTIVFACHIYSTRSAPQGFSGYGDQLGDFTPGGVLPSLVQRLIGVKRPVVA